MTLRELGLFRGTEQYDNFRRLDDFFQTTPMSAAVHPYYLEVGEPAKSVTLIGVGPDGKTVRSDSSDVAKAYLAAMGL